MYTLWYKREKKDLKIGKWSGKAQQKKKKKQALKVNEVDDFKQRQNLKTKH